MNRISNQAVLDALARQDIRLLVFAELHFESGVLRLHSGARGMEYRWGGKEWLGVGMLGEISTISETAELEATDLDLTLSGIDPTMLATALGEGYYDRDASLWLAFLDTDYQITGEPVGPFLYSMDTMEGEIGEIAKVKLRAVSPLARWESPSIRRYTDADQQEEFPGDKGFEYVSQMAAGKELEW
uniref:Uncharacterized protein n=1 Tax=Candidatus Kentrum sp. UNK TaxID=2126344 RepID=A0A451AQF4_9GAMM|nr:MAG: hypothetical protein BECKUNK1418G_GA0071005_100230 [Candidatus Kentron sp. UNK]VFK68291.1 MAG: hypothetical protein BECKUNK1418H_GA0071006_100130 [Candidatus Kentron sp. UNK]